MLKRRHTSPVSEVKVADTVTEELIYGALRREGQWKVLGLSGMTFGAVMGLGMMMLALGHETPPPALVPFNPATGMAVPTANVTTISMNERAAVQESLIYAYVRDRETYNQLDNDLRVRSVLKRSTGDAEASMWALWSSESPNYPPKKYGDRARMDVDVVSITPITNDRAQVRINKRLRDQNGETVGSFTVTLAFEFTPAETRELSDVWANPFGFRVREYAITSDRFQ